MIFISFMENLPDRLLQVHNMDPGVEPAEIEVSQFNSEYPAFEFKIPHIDHTIANMLKYELECDPAIQYVGVKLPHPLVQHMLIRVYMCEHEDPKLKIEHGFRAVIQKLDQIRELIE